MSADFGLKNELRCLVTFLQFPGFAYLHMQPCVLFPFILGFRILVRTPMKERLPSLILLPIHVVFNLLTVLFLWFHLS